jgi:glycosyltransferase involved in cell wall biosynthesis
LRSYLKHVAAQDYTGSWEIIVCDDGSEDDSLKVIRNISRSLERPLRFIWQSRIGERRAVSRNSALRCASGRIVILMDGDLAVPHDFISQHVASHANARSAVYGSRHWLFIAYLGRRRKSQL